MYSVHREASATTDQYTQTEERSIDNNDQQTQETNDWVDLTHDTDVNYLPSVARQIREDNNDIEVLFNGEFVSLNELEDINRFNDDNSIKYENIQENSNINSINNPSNNIKESNKHNAYELNNYVIDDIAIQSDSVYSNSEVIYIPNDKLKQDQSNNTVAINKSDINLKHDIGFNNVLNYNLSDEVTKKIRKRRDTLPFSEVDFSSVRSADPRPLPPLIIEGIRVEDSSKEPKIIDDGIPSVLADSSVTLR